MSRKSIEKELEFSPPPVENRIHMDQRSNPRMNEKGEEILSNISRTVNVYLPTMGERIRRYARTPEFLQDRYFDESLWDDEDKETLFNEDGSPVSIHEERYQEGLQEAKKRYKKRTDEEKEAAIQKANEEASEFEKRVREIVQKGETKQGDGAKAPK